MSKFCSFYRKLLKWMPNLLFSSKMPRSSKLTKCTCRGDLSFTPELHRAAGVACLVWQVEIQLRPPSLCFGGCRAPVVEEEGATSPFTSLLSAASQRLDSWSRPVVPTWETLSENIIKDILEKKTTCNPATLIFYQFIKNYLPSLVHKYMFSRSGSVMYILLYILFPFKISFVLCIWQLY